MRGVDTKLWNASYYGELPVALEALRAGADVNSFVKDVTPLYVAAEKGHPEVVKRLLEAGAQVDLTWVNGDTPLYIAAFNGHTEVVKRLSEAGAQVDLATTDGFTPLYVASQEGHPEVVKRLLEAGAQVDLARANGATPLYHASKKGHTEVVKRLLEAGAQVDLALTDGFTPLYIASENGHPEVVKMLIEAGANGDLASTEGVTPLIVAAEKGRTEVVKRLLEAGVRVDLTWENGATPLFMGARYGHASVVDELLRSRAKLTVNLARNDGSTPLFAAAQHGYVDVVDKLLRVGAKIEVATNDGRLPICIAAQNGHVTIVKKLLEYGAELDSTDRDGDSALHCGALNGHEDVARALLDAGADPTIRNRKGLTAATIFVKNGNSVIARLIREHRPPPATLFRAIQRGDLDSVERLVERAGLSYVYTGKRTPLHVAAQYGRAKIMEVLLNRGGSDSIRDNCGWIALHVACSKGDTETIKILLSRGVDNGMRDKHGLSPLDVAVLHGRLQAVCELDSLGARLQNVAEDGRSVLHHAVQSCNPVMVEYVLAQGSVDVNVADVRGLSPLHYAVRPLDTLPQLDADADVYELPSPATAGEKLEQHRLQIVQLLLVSTGIDINKKSLNGTTPLLVASECGDAEVVRVLLSHGARTDLTDKRGRTALIVAALPEIRSVIQLYHNREQFHAQCNALMHDLSIPPTALQLTALVPIITSVYDLRLLLTVLEVCSDDIASRAQVVRTAFDHVMRHRLTYDVDACVFFKLTLEHCERERLLMRHEFLKFDRIAEIINTEGADWVLAIKKQVHMNRWRLDTHEQHFQAMATSIHHVHAMVMENRNAITVTASRVDNLKTQVGEGRKLLGQLAAYAQNVGSRVNILNKRLQHNEGATLKIAQHLARHEQRIEHGEQTTKRLALHLANQVEKASALAAHFDQRISRSEKYITHVATQFSRFQKAYLERIDQEQRNQRIKAVCGVVASLAGMVFAPLLHTASKSVVDLMEPLNLVSLFEVEDPVKFLADSGAKHFKDGVRSLLENHAIPPDTVETLLRESIALKHPELLDDCERRGFSVYQDSGRAELVRANAASLRMEEGAIKQIVMELREAMHNTAALEAGFDGVVADVSLSMFEPKTEELCEASTGNASFENRANTVTNLIGGLRTGLEDTDNQTRLAEREFTAAPATVHLVTPPLESSTPNVLDGISPHDASAKARTMAPTPEQRVKLGSEAVAQTAHPDTSSERPGDSTSESSQVNILDDHDAFLYHAAIKESLGDVPKFQALTKDVNNDIDMHAAAEMRVTEIASSRELLCPAQYAYLLGYRDVGDIVGARMATVPDVDETPAKSVELEGDVDAFPFFLAVTESQGHVDACEDYLNALEGDDEHTIEDCMPATVVRETSRSVSWTALEYACHLGYVDIVMYLCKSLPPKTRIFAIKQARERAKALGQVRAGTSRS